MSKLLNKIKQSLLKKDVSFILFLSSIFILLLIFFLINKMSFFYQQDEYYGFFYLNSTTLLDNIKSIASIHYSPLSILFLKLQYFLFGLSLSPRIIISTSLHFITIISVFVLIKSIIKQKNIFINNLSILLLVLFLFLNVNNSQAYLWMSTYSGTIPCVIFSIWSVFFFIKFRENGNKKKLIYSIFFMILSLLFKEYSIILPLLFIIYIAYENNFSIKDLIKNEKKTIIAIFSFLLFFIIIRFLMQFSSGTVSDSNLIGDRFNILNIINSFVAYISIFIKSFWQIIIPYEAYKYLAINLLKQPNNNDTLFIVINNIQFVFGFFLWATLFIISYIKKLFSNKDVVFSFLFYVLSLIPFTLITNSISSDYLESRYYYLISITLLIFLLSFINNLNINKKIFKLLPITICLVLIPLNIFYLNNKIQIQKELSKTRINITNNIINDVKKNNPKNNLIIYIYGDNAGYYGLPDLKIPFQTGLGNILAIHLYNDKVFIDKSYFNNKTESHYNGNGFLPMNFNHAGQGIYKFENKKFGFFYKYNDLLNYFSENNEDINNLISFYWNKDENKLTNNTIEIREKIINNVKKYKLDSFTTVEKNINIITNNKYNFSVDKKIGLNSSRNENNNLINTYKEGLEQSYAASYLNFDINGKNTNKYEFNKNYNNYLLDFISSVKINGETTSFDQKISNNKIYLNLDKNTSDKDMITLNFGLKSRVFIYNIGSKDKYYIETEFIEINGENKSSYSINLENNVVSIRSIWINDTDRYVPFGFGDNGMIKIKNWSGYNTNIINFEFERKISSDEKILIPVTYYKNIETLKDDIYFNYK